MKYVQKIKTWKDNWNDIIRYVLFQDDKLKQLMLIPDSTNIIDFIDKYFIENVSGDELIFNEKVRIVWYDKQMDSTGNKNVRSMHKQIDIFVKQNVSHNADHDRLRMRHDMIATRLRYLLTKDQAIYGMRFTYVDEYQLWTKTPGYRRYHVVFSYKKSV